jgi:hypothetical protein
MAQIAQQDNLVIEVSTTAAALDGDTKKKLIECIEGGTITDVILVTKEVEKKISHARVVSWLAQPGNPQNTQLILLTQTAEQ